MVLLLAKGFEIQDPKPCIADMIDWDQFTCSSTFMSEEILVHCSHPKHPDCAIKYCIVLVRQHPIESPIEFRYHFRMSVVYQQTSSARPAPTDYVLSVWWPCIALHDSLGVFIVHAIETRDALEHF